MELRRFKTRNGSIIEEQICATTVFAKGYVDDYKVVEVTNKRSKFEVGEYICLLLGNNKFPVGGEHGKGWDIVEEIE